MSGWIVGFDARKRTWSEKQMQLLDIPFEILPRVTKPWDVVGELTREEAEKLGLKAGVPLVAGSGDIMQSNLGSGVVEPGMVSDVAGTASIFTFAVSDFHRQVTDKKVILNAVPTLENQYMYWSFIPAGGLSLRWFRDEISKEKGDDDYYARMDVEAKGVPIGSDFTYFFPFLQGRSNPAWPNASASWVGMHGSATRATLWRNMLESIAFEYKSYTDILESVGVELKRVIGTGGGSKSKLWNQIKADILGAPYVTLEKTEGAVLGNAVVAAYGVGDIKDLAGTVKDWVKPKTTVTPIEENQKVYEKMYRVRKDILDNNLYPMFDKLAELHSSIHVAG